MKKIIPYILLFFVIFITNCDDDFPNVDDCYDYDYSDCNTSKPTEGDLIIKLTINDENPEVPIIIFKGNYDNKDTLRKILYDDELLRVSLKVEEYYSVTVEYKSGNKTITAVDGDNIKIIKRYVCDSVCYGVKEGKVDLRLKD